MDIGSLIRLYRSEKDLSQRQFALIAGLSNSYISMLEKGENPKTGKDISPDVLSLNKIAKAMGITLEELLTKINAINTVTEDNLQAKTKEEEYLLTVFRSLDERGKGAVLAALDYEASVK